MKTLREMMDLIEAAQTPFYQGYDDAYYNGTDSNPFAPGSDEYRDYDRGNKAGLSDITSSDAKNNTDINVGDTITWWFNRAHPNYEGKVRKVTGNTIVVYAPGSGETYQLSKDEIRSVSKGIDQEVDEAATPEAIKQIEQLSDTK